jgi:CO/xanthine dehydrogenase Mo-binding subunit
MRKANLSTLDKGSRLKATGQCEYTSDLKLPGMLIGKALYAAHPRARITHLGTKAAEEIPGVVAVLTHHDLPKEKYFGTVVHDQQILAIDDVYYIGDMVAAVAAESEEAALKAIDVIDVRYEPLEGIFDPIEAMKEGAQLARSDLMSNILDEHRMSVGDVRRAFDEADVTIKGNFRTQCMEHMFLETEAVVADWDGDILTLYASGQHPHGDRNQVANAMGLPKNKVRVIYPYVGGGFGGKEDMHIQIHTAALAYKARRPVKMVRTRHESMFTHVKRPVVISRCEIAADSGGTIQGMRIKIVVDSGPYTNLSGIVTEIATHWACGPYKVPNAQVEGYCVATNNLISGAFRGFGGPEIAYAVEQMMDMLAERLEMDPIELRLKNAIEKGTPFHTGADIYQEIGFKDTIEKAAKAARWHEREEWLDRKPAPHLRRGIGVASIFHEPGMGRAFEDRCMIGLEMGPDASLILRTGTADIGQGAYRAQAIMAAEAMGVDVSDVRIVLPDTDVSPDSSVTSSSRQTYLTGNAILDAARQIREILFDIASDVLEASPEELELIDKKVWAREFPGRVLELPNLTTMAWKKNRPLRADGLFRTWHPTIPGIEIQHPFPNSFYSYATHIAQVLVNTETGQATVEKMWPHMMLARLSTQKQSRGRSTAVC